jgi:GNAT superfamily N-acetyltransferase
MIRDAINSDVEAIVAMGTRFLTETSYRTSIVGDAQQMTATVRHLLANDEGHVSVSTDGDTLTGMIGLFVFPHPISGRRVATELFWWVNPEHRGHGIRLLKAAEAWARAHGAEVLQMIAPSAKVERIYQALGFSRLEVTYQREL